MAGFPDIKPAYSGRVPELDGRYFGSGVVRGLGVRLCFFHFVSPRFLLDENSGSLHRSIYLQADAEVQIIPLSHLEICMVGEPMSRDPRGNWWGARSGKGSGMLRVRPVNADAILDSQEGLAVLVAGAGAAGPDGCSTQG